MDGSAFLGKKFRHRHARATPQQSVWRLAALRRCMVTRRGLGLSRLPNQCGCHAGFEGHGPFPEPSFLGGLRLGRSDLGCERKRCKRFWPKAGSDRRDKTGAGFAMSRQHRQHSPTLALRRHKSAAVHIKADGLAPVRPVALRGPCNSIQTGLRAGDEGVPRRKGRGKAESKLNTQWKCVHRGNMQQAAS